MRRINLKPFYSNFFSLLPLKGSNREILVDVGQPELFQTANKTKTGCWCRMRRTYEEFPQELEEWSHDWSWLSWYLIPNVKKSLWWFRNVQDRPVPFTGPPQCVHTLHWCFFIYIALKDMERSDGNIWQSLRPTLVAMLNVMSISFRHQEHLVKHRLACWEEKTWGLPLGARGLDLHTREDKCKNQPSQWNVTLKQIVIWRMVPHIEQIHLERSVYPNEAISIIGHFDIIPRQAGLHHTQP